MIDIKDTLKQRGERYGDFKEHAIIAQGLKKTVTIHDNWESLSADKKQAIEVIFDKVARIVNGDPEYHDNWHDIIGYAKLVADTLEVEK